LAELAGEVYHSHVENIRVQPKGGSPMSMDERVASLKAKHEALELQIHEEETRPHPDELTLHQLKKEKLRIKDEIAALH